MLNRKKLIIHIEKDYIGSLEQKRLIDNLSRVEIINEEFNKLHEKLKYSETYKLKLTPIERINLSTYRITFTDNSFKQIEKLATKLSIPNNWLYRELLISFIMEGNYRIAGRWKLLRKGMSQNKVIEILGEPIEIKKWAYTDEWLYPNELGGKVKFDINEKLEKWTEPEA